MNEPAQLQQVNRTYVRFGTRTLSYFSGCDYYRLASHPQVLAALRAGLKRCGLGVAASRLTTGNHRLYQELEARLAAFFGAQTAVLVPGGYMANLVVAQSLAGRFSHALLDADAHPSLVDAVRFLDCPVLRFASRNPEDLARTVRRCGVEAKFLVMTDGMFSRDGSVAPLRAYLDVLPKDAWLLVDDAHGAGVLGRSGQGALEDAGVSRGRIIQAISLSKAFGACGGAILADTAIRRRILERSKMYVGSTPLPLPLAAAALRSLELLRQDAGLKQRLNDNAAFVKQGVRAAGLPLPDAPGPIIPVTPQTPTKMAKLHAALLAAGIYPPFTKYPGAPAHGYFRFVISSEHTGRQLGRLVAVLARFVKRDLS